MTEDANSRRRAEPIGGEAMSDLRLAAARRRLAESSDQSDALEAIREIVSNLLGSEQMVLFAFDRQTANLRMVWSFGIDAQECNPLRILSDVCLRRVTRGECHVELPHDNRSGSAAKTRAFVPLRHANRTVGVLAILRLLPQKLGFDRLDMDLLGFLSIEAGKALLSSLANAPPGESEVRA